MRRFIFASHHKLATGLKDTVQFLTNYSDSAKQIYDISAYVNDGDKTVQDIVGELFTSFDKEDEVIVLTDMLGGSVNQSFYPYLNKNVHVITGMNLALAMSLMLLPEDEKLSEDMISDIVNECKEQIIYVNRMELNIDDNDE